MNEKEEIDLSLRFLAILQRDNAAQVFCDYLAMCRRRVETAILSGDMGDPLILNRLRGQRQAFLDLERVESELAARFADPETTET